MSELQDTSGSRRSAAADMYACSTINTIMAVAMTARKLSPNTQRVPLGVLSQRPPRVRPARNHPATTEEFDRENMGIAAKE